MYRIGLFSQMTRVTVKTLRYYDDIGLLKPAHINKDNGYRFYTTDQLLQLHQIISLKQIGFSIDNILSVINNQGESDKILEARKNEILAELDEGKERLSRINHFINERKEGHNMNYQAVVKELPECIVYSKRMILPNYDAYFSVIPALGEQMAKANPTLNCANPPYCFIIYHDGEYKESDIDVEHCEAVTEFGVETDGIVFKKMPSLTAVSVLHKGPYKDLRKAYAYALKWIADNGYTIADKHRESYIDGIWNKEDENDWLTEIQVPVRK